MTEQNIISAEITPEEKLIWEIARHWRQATISTDLQSLDWERVVEIAINNRMQILLEYVLEQTGLAALLPIAAAKKLRSAGARFEWSAALLRPSLRDYLSFAGARQQEVVVLKGLWVAEKIYGQASMRPGNDIDILVREKDIPQAIQILEREMGYGSWWRPLLDDKYYQTHHLHQQRCNEDRSIWVEPHWRLDHPYTRLTVDYEALMARTTPGELWSLPVRELSPPDLLLALSIHLVKHAVYLPSALNRADLSRLILADGMLMYFMDVAEAIAIYQSNIKWHEVIKLAKESGAVDIMGSVLKVCHDHLGSEIPSDVFDQLTVRGPGGVTRLVMERMTAYEMALYHGQNPNKMWSFLLGYSESIVFRPIRLLDFITYLFPGEEFLRRRYGRASIGRRLWHIMSTTGTYLTVAWDTAYFSLKRRREVWLLDREGYEWPPPPTVGS